MLSKYKQHHRFLSKQSSGDLEAKKSIKQSKAKELLLDEKITKLRKYIFEHVFNGGEFTITDEIFKALLRSRLVRSTDLIEELIRILEKM